VTDTPTEREGESMWTRLRRRKVVQWGLVYVAAAWGFLQGLEYVSETFQWPAQLREVALLAVLIGLPIVLILAWYHGDRGEQRVSGTEIAIIILLLALGGGIFWRYERASDNSTAAAVKADASKGAASAADARPSIAVLPFENRSDMQKDAFFVDGIHDDILTQLSKVSALRVISRTSVEHFRKSELSVQQIAQQLGVTSILEGGVQRAGDRVRVTVQLIDAATDAHVWAESYDRELVAANIFAIQSELATAIAGALKTSLTPAEQVRATAVPTQNLEAWEAYQLGRHSMARRTSESLSDAADHFKRAMERDPTFALAYVALADTLLLQTEYGGAPPESTAERASQLVERALALDPGLAEAAVSSAMLAWTLHDYPKADREFQRAIALIPNSAEANHWYSGMLAELGRRADSLKYAQRAAQLDPLSAIVRTNFGAALSDLGQFGEAVEELRRAVDIDPSQPNAYFQIGQLEGYAIGRLDQAVPWTLRAAELDPGQVGGPAWLTGMYFDLGDDATAERWLAQAQRIGAGQVPPKFLACIAALYRGRPDLAEKHARDALKIAPQATLMLQILRDADLRHDDFSTPKDRYAKSYPELVKATPRVDPGNYHAAIDLALVLRRSGNDQAALELLDLSQKVVRNGTRLGVTGSGIADVQIRALRGEKREALAALREAERAGWRGPLWRFHRDHDLNLASIRNDPQFKDVFADIELDMAAQRARLAARPKDAPLDLAGTTH
jgi:TolB-like protein/Tfp pilus assembly protein PilF